MTAFIVLLILSAIDYISGVIRAYIEKKLSSSIGFRGILKKLLMLTVVAVSYLFSYYDPTVGSGLYTLVILFYCSNEGISILENAASAGVPCPEKLKEALQTLHGKD